MFLTTYIRETSISQIDQNLTACLVIVTIILGLFIALIGFAFFIQSNTNNLLPADSIHEKAKAIANRLEGSEDLRTSFFENIDLILPSIKIEYETYPEEWEYMWFALEKAYINQGTDIYTCIGIIPQWQYMYTILTTDCPIHLFKNDCHPKTAKTMWYAVSVSPNLKPDVL